jgi:chromosome segregation ATPase
MSSTGYDRPCELILLALEEQGPLKSRELTDAAGLKKTQQVHYRYKEYLGPSEYGLVKKVSDPGRGGHTEWALTESGANYVKYNREELEKPATSTEAVEVAAELRNEVDDLKSQIESTQGTVGSNKSQIDDFKSRLDEISKKPENLHERIETLEDSVDDFVPREEVEYFVEQLEQDYVEAENAREERVEELESDITDLKDRMDSIESELRKYREFETLIEKIRKYRLERGAMDVQLDEFQERLDEFEEELDDSDD